MARNKKSVNQIFRRPLVRLILLIIIIVAIVLMIRNCFKKDEDEQNLVGYQRLFYVTDSKEYNYLDLDGKLKTYSGYKSMSDFYHEVTNVSRENEDDSSIIEYALINKNNKQVVKYGTYDNIIQVIGGDYYKVLKDGKFGVIDYNGKVIIEPQYEYISITTVQDGTEIVLECKNGDNYDIMNEKGKLLMSTTNSSHNISYINRLNSNFDTIIKVSEDSSSRYFNLETAEELFAGLTDINISYNILKEENKITIFSKDYKDSEVIDISGDYSVEARTYFNKYILVEQKNVSTGSREYKYTVYNEDLKVMAESENKINVIQSYNGDVYFLINEEEGVKLINEKKKSRKIEGYEFNSNSISDLQAIALNPIGDTNTYELFSFKGKKLDDEISQYAYKGASLSVTKIDGQKYLLFANGEKYDLTDNDNVTANDYYLTVEDTTNGTVTLISNEGKVILEKAAGTKIFYNEKYIGLQSDKTINIYNTEKGKLTYTYSLENYVDRDETVNYVELVNEYYSFDGELILQK